MALYVRVVHGVLESVGELPLYAKRLDTGELLSGGEVLKWAEACGYYPLNVDVAAIPATPAQRATLIALLAAAKARQTRRVAFEAAVGARTDLARDVNWDWIDKYCATVVGQIPYVRGQSPDAGQNWVVPSTIPTIQQAVDRLRDAVSYLLVENIQFSLAIDMLTSVVGDLLDSADIDPPADR